MKLSIELVPATSWLNNVRKILSAKQWSMLRSQVANQAYNVCEICGDTGPKYPVECHEIWHYDDKSHIQKLIGMIALCPDCHMVKHFGFARISGKEDRAIKHLMKINSINKKEAQKYIDESFKIWAERSKHDWTLDISILNDYGIKVEGLDI